MGLFGKLSNDDFASKLADHYHKHIGAGEFKDVRNESAMNNPRTPLWLGQPFQQRGLQNGKSNPNGTINFLTAPIIDTSRVAKFMASPKGLLFIAKNAGLQASNPKMEYGTPIHPGRIYNPASTVLQIPANVVGLHIDRHNLSLLNPLDINYEQVISAKTKLGLNRLVTLGDELKVGYFSGDPSIDKNPRMFRSVDKVLDKFGKLFGKEAAPIKSLSGPMGPNSLFGLGRTIIKRSSVTGLTGKIGYFYSPDTDDNYSKKNPEGVYKMLHDFDPEEGVYGMLVDTPNASGKMSTPKGIFSYKSFEYGDIVRASKENTLRDFTGKVDYTEDNVYKKYGLVDYGKAAAGTTSDDLVINDDSEYEDYVRLSIAGKIAGKETRLRFRAYNLGAITDDTSFSWNTVNYSGRTTSQYGFESVARTLSHDLYIPAFTSDELKANYKRLNKLYQIASPSFSNGIPVAPLCKFTLGDLYDDVNIVVEKITFMIEDDFPWDIGVGRGKETANAQLPTIIKLSLSYKMVTNTDGGLFTNSSRFFGSKIEEF